MTAQIQKKVTATERKALDKLLDEDFGILRGDLNRMAQEAQDNVRKDVEESSKARLTQARKIENKIKDLVRDAADKDFRVVNPNDRYNPSATVVFQVNDLEVEKAISKALTVVSRRLSGAVTLLARKQHQARRNMLIASISDEAVAILDALPSAETLMAEVAAEQKAALTT